MPTAQPSITALAPVVAAELGIEILVETSDDEGAVALVQRHPQVEVVVSRGGIAERIKTLPEISVVEISMSLNELLSNLHQLTARGLVRIGIVSRANFFGGAIGDFQILDNGIKDCSLCTIPHEKINYEYIVDKLKVNM